MSEKVVITKEQAEALVTFGWQGFEKSDILTLKFRKLEFQVDSESAYLTIKHMDLETLVKALFIGYEVEPTPEEIVRQRYLEAKRLRDCCVHKDYNQGQIDGIEMVLRTLKIKIAIEGETN